MPSALRTLRPHRLRVVLGAAVLAATAATALSAAPAQATAPARTTATETCQDCVLDARTGAHPDYDRLVFDLSGTSLPTTTATPSPDGAYDAADDTVRYPAIKGDSYLMVQMFTAHTWTADGTTYTTPRTLAVDLPSLKGVQLMDDYEGYVTFALTLGSNSGYHLSHLTSPDREVIDVYH